MEENKKNHFTEFCINGLSFPGKLFNTFLTLIFRLKITLKIVGNAHLKVQIQKIPEKLLWKIDKYLRNVNNNEHFGYEIWIRKKTWDHMLQITNDDSGHPNGIKIF